VRIRKFNAQTTTTDNSSKLICVRIRILLRIYYKFILY